MFPLILVQIKKLFWLQYTNYFPTTILKKFITITFKKTLTLDTVLLTCVAILHKYFINNKKCLDKGLDIVCTTHSQSFIVVVTIMLQQPPSHDDLQWNPLVITYSVGIKVVEFTRELNKEFPLYCYSIHINYMWSMLQLCFYYMPTLMSMCHPCIHYIYTIQQQYS